MSDLLSQLSKKGRQKVIKKAMPNWMDPMLARLTHDYFSKESWVYERKLDGQRVLAYKTANGDVTLYSRNQIKLNQRYYEIQQAVEKHAVKGCILDGEVVAFDENNVSDFQKLQPIMEASSEEKAMETDVDVYYYLFDILYVDGHDVTECALQDRKKLLRKAVVTGDLLRMVKPRKGNGIEYYKEACKKGWEGVIAKDISSPYIHGRSKKWLKFKCINQQEFVIGGFTDPHGERVGFGALLLGFYRDRDLVYAGKVGTGFDDETLKSLRGKLDKIERKTSPYDQGKPQTKEVHFVSPEMVCEVVFTEWTDADRLRHPRYKGLRDDKAPEDVTKEEESQRTELDGDE